MDEAALIKRPVAERRGAWLNDGGNTWFSILFAGGIDAVSSAFEALDDVGLVRRDVGGQVLEGKLPAPDGRWALLVELVGSNWVHFAAPETLNLFHRDFELGNKLAAATGLRVLTTGYEDCSCATFVGVQEKDRQVLRFESTGEDFHGEELTSPEEMDEEDFEDWDGSFATTFRSESHPPDWWKQFDSENEVHQALLADLDAYVPFVQALPNEAGKVELYACHEDAVKLASIRRIDLVVFGDAKLAEPSAANAELADAIREGNVGAVKAAIAAGADLSVLKNATIPPLADAVERMCAKEPQRVEVIRALLEAGADPNAGGGPEDDTPLIRAIEYAETLPTAALKVAQLLLDAGADIQKPRTLPGNEGSTPLHCAVGRGSFAAVQFLLSRGAEVSARNSAGETALDKSRVLRDSLRKHMGELAKDSILEHEKIIEYLQRVEQGGEIGDPNATIAAAQAAAESNRRRMAVAGAKFEQTMKELGKVFQQANEETRQRVEASLLAQPDSISLQPCRKADWADADRVEADTAELTAAGFTQAGDFEIDNMPGITIRAFVNPQERLVAAVGQTFMGVTWCDVVRFHDDGTALTVTTAPRVDGMDEFQPEQFEKMYCGDEPIAFLLQEMREVRPVAEPVAIEAEEFADSLERYYAEDIAAKKARCTKR